MSQQRQPIRSVEQAAFLKLQKTADQLMGEVAETVKPEDLSPTQYNALRILRAAGKAGLASGQITQRMLTREPDMTRLLDRLETRGLIERLRDKNDRRIVRGRITDKGIGMLERLDKPILELHRRQLAHLGRERLRMMIKLLDQLRHHNG